MVAARRPVVEGVPAALPDAPVLAAIIVLAVFNTAGANLMLFALVPRAGATFTSYNNYLVPTVAVICGTLFLGEPFTAGSAAGGCSFSRASQYRRSSSRQSGWGKPNLQAADCADTGLLVFRTDVSFLK